MADGLSLLAVLTGCVIGYLLFGLGLYWIVKSNVKMDLDELVDDPDFPTWAAKFAKVLLVLLFMVCWAPMVYFHLKDR